MPLRAAVKESVVSFDPKSTDEIRIDRHNNLLSGELPMLLQVFLCCRFFFVRCNGEGNRTAALETKTMVLILPHDQSKQPLMTLARQHVCKRLQTGPEFPSGHFFRRLIERVCVVACQHVNSDEGLGARV